MPAAASPSLWATTRPIRPVLCLLLWIALALVFEDRVRRMEFLEGEIRAGSKLVDFAVLDGCSVVVLLAWLSNAKWSTRVLVAGLVLAAIATCVAAFGEWPTYWRELDQATIQMALLFVVLLVLRFVGLRLSVEWPHQTPMADNQQATRIKWTILDLMLCVASLGVFLGALRALKPIALWQHGPWFYFRYRTFMTLPYALIVLAAAWATMGSTRLPFRLVTLTATIAATSVTNWVAWCWSTGHYWERWKQGLLESSEHVGLYAMLVTGSLAVFRLHGYRFIVQRRPFR